MSERLRPDMDDGRPRCQRQVYHDGTQCSRAARDDLGDGDLCLQHLDMAEEEQATARALALIEEAEAYEASTKTRNLRARDWTRVGPVVVQTIEDESAVHVKVSPTGWLSIADSGIDGKPDVYNMIVMSSGRFREVAALLNKEEKS